MTEDPWFWFCLKIGHWKWTPQGVFRYRKTGNRSGKVTWMIWERVL